MFGLSDSREGLAHDGFHHVENAESNLTICIDPVVQVVAALARQYGDTLRPPVLVLRHESAAFLQAELGSECIERDSLTLTPTRAIEGGKQSCCVCW